jgi:hypothetical protein
MTLSVFTLCVEFTWAIFTRLKDAMVLQGAVCEHDSAFTGSYMRGDKVWRCNRVTGTCKLEESFDWFERLDYCFNYYIE